MAVAVVIWQVPFATVVSMTTLVGSSQLVAGRGDETLSHVAVRKLRAHRGEVVDQRC